MGPWTFRLPALASFTFAIMVGPHSLQAGGKEEPVKITAKAAKADSTGKQKVTLTLDIEEGWYVYANPVGNEEFASNAIQIKAKGATIKVNFPPAKVKKDVLDGKEIKYNIYKGQVDIVAEVQRKGDGGVLEFSVRYNACNEKGICLPPRTKKLTVE